MAMLIGAMASAEERQLGTAEWQILLPMPAWQQWVLKAGVALGLAVLLGVGLPAALRYFSPAGDDIHQAARAWREITGAVVILTSASLYVSSLCASGVRALVLTFPTIVASALFVVAAGDFIGRVLFRLVHQAGSRPLIKPVDVSLALVPIGSRPRRPVVVARVPQSPVGGSQRGSNGETGPGHHRIHHARHDSADSAASAIRTRTRVRINAATRRKRSRVPQRAHPSDTGPCATPRSARSAPACRSR